MEDNAHFYSLDRTITGLVVGGGRGNIQTSQKAVAVAGCGERFEELKKNLSPFSPFLLFLTAVLFSLVKGVFHLLLFKRTSPFRSIRLLMLSLTC